MMCTWARLGQETMLKIISKRQQVERRVCEKKFEADLKTRLGGIIAPENPGRKRIREEHYLTVVSQSTPSPEPKVKPRAQ